MLLKKVNKKPIVSLAIASIASMAISAHATVNGPYVGGQIGYGNVHKGGFSSSDFTVEGGSAKTSSKDTGVAGRVYAGYQFMQNFAAEMGYSKFSNATSKATLTTPEGTQTANGTIKTYAVDLMGKVILPLQNCFNIYGKAGLAYLSATGDVKVTAPGVSAKVSETDHHLYPAFGAGVGYDVTKNIVADVSWNHIQKTGGSSNLANTDLYAVGLAYNFG